MILSIKKLLSNKYNLWVLALIFFHISFNLIFQIINKAPPTWDSAGHLTLSFIFLDKLQLIPLGRFDIVDFLKVSTYYPPLVHILGAFVMLFVGRVFEFPLFVVGTVSFVFCIVYLYKIVLFLFKDNHKLAFFTVLFFSFFPQIWEQSRNFHLDVPLCALLLASYYYLLLSHSLKNRLYSFIFFVLFSLIQLTKWYGFVYLIVPFVYEVFIRSFKSKDLFYDVGRWFNILFGYLVVACISLPWYFLNFQSILANVKVSATADAGDPLNIWSIENFYHYIKLMMSYQLGIVSVAVLLVSLIFLYLHKVSFRKYIIWLIVFPYLVLSLIQNKDLRYILPMVPVFAFCVAYLFCEVIKKFQSSFTYLYTFYLLFLFFFLSLNPFTTLPKSLNFVAWLMAGPYNWAWETMPYSYAYSSGNWGVEDILKVISKEASLESTITGTYKVLEISDNRYYSIASFDMFKMQNAFYDMDFVVPYNRPDKLSPEELATYLSNIHFAIVPQNPGPSGLRNIAVLNQLIDYFTSNQNTEFAPIKEFDMPDGNKLRLYKRVNFLNFKSPESTREDSLKIYLSNILFLNSDKIKTQVFEVHTFDELANDTVYKMGTDGVTQKRISLEGVKKIRIDLPREQLDIKHMTGWAFRDMTFVRIPDYNFSTYLFKNGLLKPLDANFDISKLPDVVSTFVEYTDKGISIVNKNPNESVYVAYATKGWKWDNFWLKDKNGETTMTKDDLIQFDITQPNQIIKNFPSNWGFFPCYDGSAVCFYPIVDNL